MNSGGGGRSVNTVEGGEECEQWRWGEKCEHRGGGGGVREHK